MDTNEDGSTYLPPPPIPVADGPSLLPPPQIDPQSPPFVPHADAATATVVPTNAGAQRGKGKIVGAVIGVIALVAAGGFAITKIVAGNDGGAANPSGVGTKLMDALAAEDALGVVDLLLPGERDMLRQPLIDLVDNLKRLEIADDTASLDKVGGIDLAFEDVKVDETDTNVDDVTNIRITATSTASVDGKRVPIGPLLIDEAFGGDRPDMGSDPQDSDVDWSLATVKRDGRWYLSAFYSIAESARNGGDDIPEQALTAVGADTPDAAVQAIFDAVDDLDLEALIAALNPDEAEALQRYAPIFIDQGQRALDDLDAKIAFSDTKFTVNGSGDRRSVTVDGFTLKASANGTDVTVENKDGCTVVTSGDTTADTCKGGSSIDEALTTLGIDDSGDLQALVKTVEDAFSDTKPVGITVQKVDGKWFVSPVGTFLDILLGELSALDKGELTDIIDGAKKVSQSLSTQEIFSSSDGSGDVGSGDTSDSGALDRCYGETEYAAFSACITAGIDDGSIDSSFVAPYYRFADCGVGEMYFNGDIYSLSDDEFTTFAMGAAPCFQPYVADGTISEFELPYELSRPDCLEGRNWYNVTDTDYTDRVLQCVT